MRAAEIHAQVDAWRDARTVEVDRWEPIDSYAGHPMQVSHVGFGGVTYWRTVRPVAGRHLWRVTTRREEG